MSRGGLGLRLAFAFAAVAALTALLSALLLWATWERDFVRYVREGLQERADDAAGVMAGFYTQSGGTWDPLRFVDLSHVGMVSTGFRISVFDERGTLVADSIGLPGSHSGVGPGQTPSQEELERMGGGITAAAPVAVDGRVVGEVRVSTLTGSGALTQRDVEFRRASLQGLLVAALLAVAAATVAGVMVARGVVRPINLVTEVASRLRSGERQARTEMQGKDAISQLGMTFDQMAESIEADREFERRLTADVAHELRTPLQAIQATVEAMQDGVLPADVERLGAVADETVRLARLADSILELARLERGSVEFRMQPLDLAEPVRASVESHRALVESCGLTLQTDLAGGVWIRGDRDRLQQAVGNLLSNAARYTSSGGDVSVRMRAVDGEASVSVQDTGIGISSEDLGRVFARFWRADLARTRSRGGVGIGLSVVKEIVERHSGRMSVQSTEGAGSTFTMHLPLLGSGTIRPGDPRVTAGQWTGSSGSDS